MNLSLISCHIMRVISSPSSSTTGFLTLIFLKPDIFLRCWYRADADAGIKMLRAGLGLLSWVMQLREADNAKEGLIGKRILGRGKATVYQRICCRSPRRIARQRAPARDSAVCMTAAGHLVKLSELPRRRCNKALRHHGALG